MSLPRQKPWMPEGDQPDLVFTNANVVDVSGNSTLSNCTVHISGGNIKSITALGDTMPSSRDDTTAAIDLKGKYLCPGLIDCHVHLTAAAGGATVRDLFAAHPSTLAYRTAWNAKQMLLRGFTTARDTAGADFALRDAIAEGLVVGPRLFIAGKALSQTGGHGDLRMPYEDDSFKCCGGNHAPGIARICDGVPECLAAARDELRQGADFLKIMVGGGVASPVDPLEMLQFTAEEIGAITTSARHLGKYVTAHAYTVEAIRHAVDNGVMGIEHGNFIDAATAKLCAEKGVFVTPTLIIYHALANPPFEHYLPEDGRAKCKQVLDSGVECLKVLHENGVTICYGTDLLAGMPVMQNREFSIRAQALPAIEVLRSATVNAAKLLGMEGKLGTVSKGAIADLLVLDKNPLEDVTVLDEIGVSCHAIIKEGRVVASRISHLEVDGLYL